MLSRTSIENNRDELGLMLSYSGAAERIQELDLAKRKDEEITAVPDAFVDQGVLVGPMDRIERRCRDWRDCSITGLTIWGAESALQLDGMFGGAGADG